MTNDKFKEAELLLKIYEMYSSDSMIDAFTWLFKDFHAEKHGIIFTAMIAVNGLNDFYADCCSR